MPVYNAALYITEAVGSVLSQTYANWELIIVNDGSTDDSEKKIRKISDQRIRYVYQNNGGVSSARNTGLRLMRGVYFCFLDADDVMPSRSLASRIEAFQHNKDLTFVDGIVLRKDGDLNRIRSIYTPNFSGNPQSALLRLSSNCFLGNTWMVKRNFEYHYAFNEELSHLEDYLFFLQISKQGLYGYVLEEILWYRQGNNTAMSNLAGLEKGYFYIYNFIKRNNMASEGQLLYLKYRISRIMFLSYLFLEKNPKRAIGCLFNFFR
jgi:teichuronic acid biosynthesis glycosyltransferase TuaG